MWQEYRRSQPTDGHSDNGAHERKILRWRWNQDKELSPRSSLMISERVFPEISSSRNASFDEGFSGHRMEEWIIFPNSLIFSGIVASVFMIDFPPADSRN